VRIAIEIASPEFITGLDLSEHGAFASRYSKRQGRGRSGRPDPVATAISAFLAVQPKIKPRRRPPRAGNNLIGGWCLRKSLIINGMMVGAP
jgi:hypothetical protein